MTTLGEESDAIHATTGGDIEIEQTGDISTGGTGSIGIYALTADGDIEIEQAGDITTEANASMAIFALSTDGDIAVTQTGDVTVLGAGGAPGFFLQSTYGDVALMRTGDLTMHGSGAPALFARSANGSVAVTQAGDVTMYGSGAPAIFVQAAEGATLEQTGDVTMFGYGASFAAVAASSISGDITMVHNGDVTGLGLAAGGISAESGSGDIAITLNGSTVSAADAVAIEFSGGGDNTLTVNDTVSISGASSDVIGGDGSETIMNHGWLTMPGDSDLGAGANAFMNFAGAVFNSGTSINLGGAGNALTNYGTLSPGGVGNVQTTVLTGDLVLSPIGIFAVDVNGASGVADRIEVAGGGAASVSGDLALNFVSLDGLPSGPYTIVDTGTALTGPNDIAVLNPLVDATVTYPGNEDVAVEINGFDFAADGLNENQTSIGEHFNDAFDLGRGELDPILLSLANLTSIDGLDDLYDQFSPEVYLDGQIATLHSSREFSDLMLSCATNQPGALSVNREGQCIWGAAAVRYFDQDGTSESIGFDETAAQFAAGAQFAIDDVWRAGFGIGYQRSWLDSDGGASSDGDLAQGGVSVKYNPGNTLLAAVVSGGRAWYDTSRPISFGGRTATATVDVFAGRLHASHAFGAPEFYVKPMVDAAVTWVDLGDFTESGAGPADLVVNGNDETVFTISPAFEIGAQYWFADEVMMRPFARAGVTWFSEDTFTVSSSFAGAPDGIDPFSISTQTDAWTADVAVGLEVVGTNNNSARIYYDGRFGDTTQSHTAGLKGTIGF